MDLQEFLKQEMTEIYIELPVPSMLTPHSTLNFTFTTDAPTSAGPSFVEEVLDDTQIPTATDAGPQVSEPMPPDVVPTPRPTVTTTVPPCVMYVLGPQQDRVLKNMMSGLFAADHGGLLAGFVGDLYGCASVTDSVAAFSNLLAQPGPALSASALIGCCMFLLPGQVSVQLMRSTITENKLFIALFEEVNRHILRGGNPLSVLSSMRNLGDPNINEAITRGLTRNIGNIQLGKRPLTQYKLIALLVYILDLVRYAAPDETMRTRRIIFDKVMSKVSGAAQEHAPICNAIAGWIIGGARPDCLPDMGGADLEYATANIRRFLQPDPAQAPR